MINGAALVVITVLSLANGLDTDGGISAWRFAGYPVLGVAAYLTARHLPVRHGGVIIAVIAGAAGVATTIVVSFAEGITVLLSFALSMLLPWLTGRFRRQQAELVVAGQRQVAQLEREQEFVAEQARQRERERIATDMHDSLGHELALIAVRAGALELSPEMSAGNRAAAAQLRANAVAATDRLRETIGMLRRSGDGTPFTPPDESVAALVKRAGDAGMSVSLHRDGSSAALPPLVDRAVHRVVQEALTNAARYAPGAAVSVRLRRTDHFVEVSVTNPLADETVTTRDSGSGLLGLRERIRLLGGELHAGPGDGGFTVTAHLPVSFGDTTGETS